MASTDKGGEILPVVGASLANGLIMAYGRATLSSGTVEVVTGLSEVHAFVATQIADLTATEACILQVDESLPLSGGTVTVDGIAADVGGATVGGDAEQFCWIAIGRR